jgi:hypothetical protein
MLARPIGEPACEYHKLVVGLDLKFLPDPPPLRGDTVLSVTEFLCDFLVCHPACESPQQLLLARAKAERDFALHLARVRHRKMINANTSTTGSTPTPITPALNAASLSSACRR